MERPTALTRVFTAFVALTLLAGCAPAATPVPLPTSTPNPPTATLPTAQADSIASIDTLFDQLNKDGLFSGALLVAQNGDVLLSKGYGLADRAKKLPFTAQTRIRIGEITMQFTAMAILILEAQGKLSTKDLVCKYVADCPLAWTAITINHLLTSTSGIPDFASLPDYLSTRATPSAPLQTLARVKGFDLNFQPGEGWGWSSSGYVLLGYVIEQVSGQSYEDFLSHSIFTPLEMRDTGYDHNSSSLAVTYSDPASTVPADYIDMSIPFSAGGLYSTVEDLLRWDQALYTERLVPRASLDRMFAPQVAIPESGGWSFGDAWVISQERGRPLDFLYGGGEGFIAYIGRYPDQRITVIVLSNQSIHNGDVGDLMPNVDTLSRTLFGDK